MVWELAMKAHAYLSSIFQQLSLTTFKKLFAHGFDRRVEHVEGISRSEIPPANQPFLLLVEVGSQNLIFRCRFLRDKNL